MPGASPAFSARVAEPNGSGLSLEELESLVAEIVGGIHARRRAHLLRRNPADDLAGETVFSLEEPVTRWLDSLRTCEGLRMGHRARKRLLTRLIEEHLETPLDLKGEWRPLPKNPFLDGPAPAPATMPPKAAKGPFESLIRMFRRIKDRLQAVYR